MVLLACSIECEVTHIVTSHRTRKAARSIPLGSGHSSKHSRRVAWANLPPGIESIKGEMLHVTGFLAGQNELCHPLPYNRRELESIHSGRKVLSSVVFLTLWRLVRYYSMKKDEQSYFFLAHPIHHHYRNQNHLKNPKNILSSITIS